LREYGGQGEERLLSGLVLEPHPFLEKLDSSMEEWEEEEENGDWEKEDGDADKVGGDLVDDDDQRILAELHKKGSVERGVLHLDPMVNTWADYCKATLNPRSLVGLGGRTATGEGICTSSYKGSSAQGLRAGLAGFEAFTDGSGLVDEVCLDRIRWALEGSDSITGFQVVTDINSGWAGFSLDVLTAIREECPRSPILVLGVSPPTNAHTAAAAAATQSSTGEVGSNIGMDPLLYADRLSRQLSVANMALSYAAFGAGELDCTLCPISFPSQLPPPVGRASVAASCFPGLLPLDPRRPYQSSIHAAIAWDTLTLPFRRSAAGSGEGFAGCPATTLGDDGGGNISHLHSASISNSRSGVGGRESSSNVSAQALVSLPLNLHMSEYLTFLRAGRSRTHRISAVSTALPFPHPRISPVAFSNLLAASPPPSSAFSIFTPLSFPNFLAATTCHASPAGPPPFAHALVTRGVGSGYPGVSRAVPGMNNSYSRALDAWMARDDCREAGHAFLHTPLPLPITLPRLFPKNRYDSAGGLSRAGSSSLLSAFPALPKAWKITGWPPTTLSPATPIVWQSSSLSGAGTPLPFSTPLALHISTAPSLVQCSISPLLRAFSRRDTSIDARYGGETSGVGGGAHTSQEGGGNAPTFSDALDALAELREQYTASGP